MLLSQLIHIQVLTYLEPAFVTYARVLCIYAFRSIEHRSLLGSACEVQLQVCPRALNAGRIVYVSTRHVDVLLQACFKCAPGALLTIVYSRVALAVVCIFLFSQIFLCAA